MSAHAAMLAARNHLLGNALSSLVVLAVIVVAPKDATHAEHKGKQRRTDRRALHGTNHVINNFDLYYQDVQQRIKDQQFPNRDLPRKGQEKIDITIVVDMLLTGFDAKFLNTLYVDKNLKHHGLIQAFSRTNRVLNATKPYGNILDFRNQQDSVDAAIALFSGAHADRAREIWLVDKPPVVIGNFKQAVADLGEFMQSQGLEATPDQVNNLMGDDARAQFIKRFKEVQRLQTQLDQYTDLTDEQREQIEQALPKEDLRAFRGVYLETAQRLKEQQRTPAQDGEPANPEVDQLDFEFVLFASALIDYDYIMKLIAKYSGQDPKKLTISREQLIGLIQSDAKFLNEREEITEYVRSLKEGEGLDEAAIRAARSKLGTRAARHLVVGTLRNSTLDFFGGIGAIVLSKDRRSRLHDSLRCNKSPPAGGCHRKSNMADLQETQHESFRLPTNKDIPIWRYMDLAKYLSMLDRRRLFFGRATLLGDPFEGSSTKAMVESREYIKTKEVYEAYKAVKSNAGSAGVDGQTIEQFESDLRYNLYKLWNRMSSGSYFPPPVRTVPC
jgi:hypothetical protein